MKDRYSVLDYDSVVTYTKEPTRQFVAAAYALGLEPVHMHLDTDDALWQGPAVVFDNSDTAKLFLRSLTTQNVHARIVETNGNVIVTPLAEDEGERSQA